VAVARRAADITVGGVDQTTEFVRPIDIRFSRVRLILLDCWSSIVSIRHPEVVAMALQLRSQCGRRTSALESRMTLARRLAIRGHQREWEGMVVEHESNVRSDVVAVGNTRGNRQNCAPPSSPAREQRRALETAAISSNQHRQPETTLSS